MDRILVVIFDNEKKAYEGSKALVDLADDGHLTVYAYAVLGKDAQGKVTTKKTDDVGPLGTLIGTSLGSLLGLLAGPAGAAIGATAGLAGGSFYDLRNIDIGDDFLEDVSKALKPNTFALVAEIDEDWVTPLDSRMEELGGDVHRRALSEVTHDFRQKELDAMKSDLAQMKAERAKASADRQAKLQAKVASLEAKIDARIRADEERKRQAQRIAEAKAKILQAKAASKSSYSRS